MLAGEGATEFAKMMGLQEEDLGTDDSHKDFRAWTASSCQPNYYRNFVGAETSCPPYDSPTSPASAAGKTIDTSLEQQGKKIFPTVGRSDDPARLLITENNHDTIGIIAVDEHGDLACGTTTNGAANRSPVVSVTVPWPVPVVMSTTTSVALPQQAMATS